MKPVYKCQICGNIVELLHDGSGALVCCGQSMNLLKEKKAQDETDIAEKHVPIINGNAVKVGSVEHPMTKEHFIEWIEATDGKEIAKVFLTPEESPRAEFSFEPTEARAFCNLHELWEYN